jgi:hypothetical protein
MIKTLFFDLQVRHEQSVQVIWDNQNADPFEHDTHAINTRGEMLNN